MRARGVRFSSPEHFLRPRAVFRCEQISVRTCVAHHIAGQIALMARVLYQTALLHHRAVPQDGEPIADFHHFAAACGR